MSKSSKSSQQSDIASQAISLMADVDPIRLRILATASRCVADLLGESPIHTNEVAVACRELTWDTRLVAVNILDWYDAIELALRSAGYVCYVGSPVTWYKPKGQPSKRLLPRIPASQIGRPHQTVNRASQFGDFQGEHDPDWSYA